MIIRLSAKMAKKIKVSNLSPMAPAADPHLDWYADPFSFGRARYIILVNCASIFSVVAWCTGVTNTGSFIKAIDPAMRDVLCTSGFGEIYKTKIAPNLASAQFAKAQDRHVIGCLNQQIYMALANLEYDDLNPSEISFKVNENILSYIKYKTPIEMFGEIQK